MMRILQPGFFRVALASAVVLSHLSNFEIGRPAVFAFFALSGFWVMRMYDEKYSVAGGAGVYFLSRWLRIWLPFLAAYLGFLLVKAVFFGEFDARQLASLGILGIATTENDVLGISWSLDIELQFYLIVPLIWSMLKALDAADRPAIWPILLATLPLSVLGWWLGLSHGIWTVLAYLPGFVAGLLIWHSRWRPARGIALLSIAAFLVAGLIVWLLPDTHAYLLKDTPNALHEDWFGMAWVALLIPFIAFNVRQRSDWLDQHLGNFSYALYITHWPVIWCIKNATALQGVPLKLVALTAVALVAVAFYVTIDRNAERLRQAILGWRMRNVAPGHAGS